MLRPILVLSLTSLWCAACAAGKEGPTGPGGGGGTTTSSTTTTSASDGTGASGAGGSGGSTSSTGGSATTSTEGGTGGTGGSITTSAEGGTGGTTMSTSSSSTSAPPTETAILFATGSASTLAADDHPDEAWTTAMLAGGSAPGAAAALLDAGEGVGLIRLPADGSLLFSKYSAGAFAAPLAIGNLAKAMDAPAMAAWNGTAAVAYHKADFKHYFALYQGPMAGWSPVAEPILANNVHSFGPSAPAIAIVGDEVVVAYAGDNGNLYDQRRVNGVWQTANGHGVDGTINLSPTIIALEGGAAEAMIAYVRKSDTQVLFTVRTAGAWSAPAAVPDAFSNDPVALAPTPNGGAALAFRGTNAMLYTSSFSPAANPQWSAPKSFGVSVPAPPALAPGIGGADAEMVLVNAGQAQHSRLTAGVWSVASQIGGADLTSIAIATFAP